MLITDQVMDIAWVIGIVVVYFALQLWVLPRFGVGT
jgi:hypothetical protein